LRALRIGSRGSRLARAQVKEIVDLLGIEDYELVVLDTAGDRDKATPISDVEGTDFFTDIIEKALSSGDIDVAVHSAKDLPKKLPDDLFIAAKTETIDKDDVLISKRNVMLNDLPTGAVIGTSSERRKNAIKELRPDLKLSDLRGNIEERLEKLDRGEYDAIVVAAAALIRLGLKGRIGQRLPIETAEGQGSLAVEIRKDDLELKEWLEEKSI
jgi:hydroxymethylbilane synthase